MAKKILLDKINVPGIKTYDVYRQQGGYASVEKALKTALDRTFRANELKKIKALDWLATN